MTTQFPGKISGFRFATAGLLRQVVTTALSVTGLLTVMAARDNEFGYANYEIEVARE
jgi:hypothetical protein